MVTLKDEQTARHLASTPLDYRLPHIDCAIKLFDPDYDLRRINPHSPRKKNPWFEHGELGRWILETMRVANGPLSTRDLAESLIRRSGKPVNGKGEWNNLMKLVVSSLRRLEGNGYVQAAGKGSGPRNAPILWLPA